MLHGRVLLGGVKPDNLSAVAGTGNRARECLDSAREVKAMSRPIHRTAEPWPAWVIALLALAGIGVGVSILGAGVGELGSGGMLGLGGAGAVVLAGGAGLGVVGLFYALFGRLYLSLFPDRVQVHFGPLGLIRRSIPLDRIREVDSVRYHPIREFGGWGIRFRGSRTAWTIRGDQAVRLALDDGSVVYLGTSFPQRWKERIETVRSQGAQTD